MKYEKLIANIKHLQKLLPFSVILSLLYQLVELHTHNYIGLFSWSQLITDTLIILPLLVLIAIIYLTLITGIKFIQEKSYVEGVEWIAFGSLLIVISLVWGYQALTAILLACVGGVVLTYIFSKIIVDQQIEKIGYTKFYNRALKMLPYIVVIIAILISYLAHGPICDHMNACVQTAEGDTCTRKHIDYMNDKRLFSENHEVYPVNAIVEINISAH